MRTAFSASTLFLALAATLSAAAQKQLTITPGKTLTCTARHRETFCDLDSPDFRHRHILLKLDSTVNSHATPSLKLIGISGDAFIITDSYPSAAGGLSQCQSGTEVFLRILSTHPAAAAHHGPLHLGLTHPNALVQTFQTKLESCHNNTELALDGVAWDAPVNTLHIHWLASPDGHKEKRTILPLTADGAVNITRPDK
jgi:hypothetical protein